MQESNLFLPPKLRDKPLAVKVSALLDIIRSEHYEKLMASPQDRWNPEGDNFDVEVAVEALEGQNYLEFIEGESDRKDMVRLLTMLYRLKGTRRALVMILSILGLDGRIVSYFDVKRERALGSDQGRIWAAGVESELEPCQILIQLTNSDDETSAVGQISTVLLTQLIETYMWVCFNLSAIVVLQTIVDDLGIIGGLDLDLTNPEVIISPKSPFQTCLFVYGDPDSDYFGVHNYDDEGITYGDCGPTPNPGQKFVYTCDLIPDEMANYEFWVRDSTNVLEGIVGGNAITPIDLERYSTIYPDEYEVKYWNTSAVLNPTDDIDLAFPRAFGGRGVHPNQPDEVLNVDRYTHGTNPWTMADSTGYVLGADPSTQMEIAGTVMVPWKFTSVTLSTVINNGRANVRFGTSDNFWTQEIQYLGSNIPDAGNTLTFDRADFTYEPAFAAWVIHFSIQVTNGTGTTADAQLYGRFNSATIPVSVLSHDWMGGPSYTPNDRVDFPVVIGNINDGYSHWNQFTNFQAWGINAHDAGSVAATADLNAVWAINALTGGAAHLSGALPETDNYARSNSNDLSKLDSGAYQGAQYSKHESFQFLHKGFIHVPVDASSLDIGMVSYTTTVAHVDKYRGGLLIGPDHNNLAQVAWNLGDVRAAYTVPDAGDQINIDLTTGAYPLTESGAFYKIAFEVPMHIVDTYHGVMRMYIYHDIDSAGWSRATLHPLVETNQYSLPWTNWSHVSGAPADSTFTRDPFGATQIRAFNDAPTLTSGFNYAQSRTKFWFFVESFPFRFVNPGRHPSFYRYGIGNAEFDSDILFDTGWAYSGVQAADPAVVEHVLDPVDPSVYEYYPGFGYLIHVTIIQSTYNGASQTVMCKSPYMTAAQDAEYAVAGINSNGYEHYPDSQYSSVKPAISQTITEVPEAYLLSDEESVVPCDPDAQEGGIGDLNDFVLESTDLYYDHPDAIANGPTDPEYS